LRAAAGALSTGTVWCMLGGGVVRLDHWGHVQTRLNSGHSTTEVRPARERVCLTVGVPH
jgi:hypothetical protein